MLKILKNLSSQILTTLVATVTIESSYNFRLLLLSGIGYHTASDHYFHSQNQQSRKNTFSTQSFQLAAVGSLKDLLPFHLRGTQYRFSQARHSRKISILYQGCHLTLDLPGYNETLQISKQGVFHPIDQRAPAICSATHIKSLPATWLSRAKLQATFVHFRVGAYPGSSNPGLPTSLLPLRGLQVHFASNGFPACPVERYASQPPPRLA